MGDENKTVAFQARVLYRGNAYDNPLYDSEFLEIYKNQGSERAKEYILSNGFSSSKVDFALWQGYTKSKYDHRSQRRYHFFTTTTGQQMFSWLPQLKSLFHESFQSHALSGIDGIALYMETICAMRSCYYSCISAKREPSSTSSFFALLYAASCYYQAQIHAIEEHFRYFSPQFQEVIEADNILSGSKFSFSFSEYYKTQVSEATKQIGSGKEFIYGLKRRSRKSGYQIVKVFDAFIEWNKIKYEKYDRVFGEYKTKRKHPTTTSTTIRFWDNPMAHEHLRLEFIAFCLTQDLTDEEKGIIRSQDCKALADLFLDELDAQLIVEIERSSPYICTKDGSLCWNTDSLPIVEYLCLYRDLMSQKEYRVCPICKSIFYVEGKGVSRKYCPRHTRDQVDYYKRRLKATIIEDENG